MSGPLSGGAEVRFATEGDTEPICRLLVEQFPGSSVALWRSTLAYPWIAAAEKPDFGVVLVVGGELCGYQGLMYADRPVNGRTERFCNGFGWCVRPAHRRHSVSLLRPVAQKSPNATFTNLTSRQELVPLFLRLGYRLADERKFLCYPGVRTALRGRAPRARIVPEGEISEALVGAEALRIYQDHLGRLPQQAVFEAGGAGCLVVTKRTYHPGVGHPFTELFYASDTAFLRRHFEQIKLRVMLRDHTAGISADERLLGFAPPGARVVPATALFKSPSVPAAKVDPLYSELVILPG